MPMSLEVENYMSKCCGEVGKDKMMAMVQAKVKTHGMDEPWVNCLFLENETLDSGNQEHTGSGRPAIETLSCEDIKHFEESAKVGDQGGQAYPQRPKI
jgi:hypothetical protein